MDEVAAALNLDPIEFRLRHVKDPRDIAVIKAAAEKAGWQSRPSPRKDQTGSKVSGRGIAYSQRNGTARRHRRRGRCRPLDRQDLGAQVHGRARLRPDHQSRSGSRTTIEGNIVQGVSRTLWEEVKFDSKNVTSIDWMTYPILDITETPETIDVVLIDRPEIAPTRRRRAVDPPGRGGHRQRDLRRHRRAHPAGAVLARPGEAGAVVMPRWNERAAKLVRSPPPVWGGVGGGGSSWRTHLVKQRPAGGTRPSPRRHL